MPRSITIFHSPDADDTFMFYGLFSGAVTIPGYEFNLQHSDIESLNHRALKGELDVTAVSVHAFGHLSDQYAILRCGSSMGGPDYGPRLVAKPENKECFSKQNLKIAIPGELTSAALALKLFLKSKNIIAQLVPVYFEEVTAAIQAGEVDAGLIIHEGQITHHRDGLIMVLDLGAWWWSRHALPLPLGVNVVNKRLGAEGMQAVFNAVDQSIRYGLTHRREALTYAQSYGRGLTNEDTDKFVSMYVNQLTQDMGEPGMKSIRLFLEEGKAAGIIPTHQDPTFIP